MNKNEVKKFFWNIVNEIEDVSDTIVKNEAEAVVERGMQLSNGYSIMYGLDDGVIRIYNKEHFPIAAFTEESETLLILKELFELLGQTAPEVPVQEQSVSKYNLTNDITADIAERLIHGKNSINEIRTELGLNPIKDQSADKLFITKE